ncbi:MAG: Hpt domain-containing protein [Gammaproteobacteria bacterium]|nr:Hpt domain-containing protein [Gammaproteobacteria bacterium]
MSTFRKVDPSTLGWVKNEIDETLKQARVALEEFVENPVDRARLRFCITHLHQVVGTLLMVELDGAAMMAREVEALAESVFDEKVEPSHEVLEALTRGILILPDYLARLQVGYPDVPLKHLPLLNELRAARKAEPVSELEFFQPDLSVRPPTPAAPRERLTDADYAALARQLRPSFQGALLSWLRDTNDKPPLQTIAGALDELQLQAGMGVLEQLFWVAGGLLAGMIDGDLEPTAERKKLLARVDQQIKKIVDGAEKSMLRSSSEALVRSVLFDLAQVGSDSPKVRQLKQAFGLDALLGRIDDEPNAGDDQSSPEVMESVSRVLAKEIEQAQDLLASAFDSGQTDAASLAPLRELLRKMAGTLEMMGMPLLRRLVEEFLATCEALGEGQIENPPAASMPMAETLVLIEAGARDVHGSVADWKHQIDQAIVALRSLYIPSEGPPVEDIDVSEAELTESDYKQLLGVVATEVGVNLTKIEEALEGFATHNTQLERLDDVPKQLGQIQGALEVLLGVERVVELTSATRQHVEDIRRKTLTADSAILDGLAVCIGTIGAYVDGLRAGRKNLDPLIESALREMRVAVQSKMGGHSAAGNDPLTTLRMSLDAWLAEPSAADAFAAVQNALTDVSTQLTHDPERTRQIVAEMDRLLELVAEDPSALSAEVRLTLRASCDALGQRASVPSSVPAAAPASPPPAKPTPAAPADDFDEEILQIFIEDARDVLGNIGREYPGWRAKPDNHTALADVRRGYHTLKGSGRMVGATVIAEFAWSVENMLNHVRDGKIQTSPMMFEIIDQSLAVLPLMVAQLEGGPAPDVDIAALERRAHDLVENRGASTKPATPTSKPLPKLDGPLLEIFTNEARGHVRSIQTEIAGFRGAGGTGLPTGSLMRSIHTLQGNARSLGIPMMADACAELEKLLHALQARHLPLVDAHLGYFESFTGSVNDLVDAVASGMGASDDLTGRFDQIARSAKAEHESIELPEAPEINAAEIDDIVVADNADDGIELIGASEPTVDDESAYEVVEVAPAPPPIAATPIAPPPPAAPISAVPESVIDQELLEIFREEAADILNTVEQMVGAWRAQPDNMSPLPELKRALHTLKGGARMAGALDMGNLSHITESLLMQVESRTLTPGPVLFDLLEESHDLLVSMLGHIGSGEPQPGLDALTERLNAVAAGRPMVAERAAEPPVFAPAPPMAEEPAPTAATEPESESTSEPESEIDLEPVAEFEPEMLIDVPEPVIERSSPPPVIPAAPVAPPVVARPPEPTPRPVAPITPVPTSTPKVAAPVRIAAEAQDITPPPAEGEGIADRRGADRQGQGQGQIRVRTDLLNNLVNYAGEVSISRARMEQQIYGFRDNLAELRRNVTRFREQLRELEIQSESQILYRVESGETSGVDFDPLEFDRFSKLQQLTRSLTESLHDLTTIQLNMGAFVGEAETVLQQQARLNTDLQEGLMRTRMVEFSTQAARLRHIVRQTARDLGKRCELDIAGADVQIDRTVLERMIGPFEHMIRNSLDHGIESEADRVSLGKPPAGRITIHTAQEGSEIVIRFGDDGAGMNLDRIRAKAIERGLVTVDANLTEEDILQFVLLSGFSTAATITQVSGRGVGMDVVHSEVKQLGGSMVVKTEPGKGTTFHIRLPLTLSIAQALMVYVGEHQYAIPIASVANIIECPVEQLTKMSVGKHPLLNHNDQLYSYMNLGARLGITSTPSGRSSRKVPVLLARAGTRDVALHVDGLGGTREIVIKALGPQLVEIKGVSGATIMGDGRVVLILDIAGLWHSEDMLLRVEHSRLQAVEPAAPVRERPIVMVVDDSLTVRKVTGKHLQKRGFDVMVAKDGVDAVEQLRNAEPDLMLVDIEMPRMDGYELTGRVRSEARLKHIPIIMITSRAGAKHRQKAFELGVDMYMSKPYQEEELFKNIDALLAKGRIK